jgi:hypothetical protein
MFLQNNQSNTILIKESNRKLHLSTIKHLCHLNSDLKFNEKQLNLQISLVIINSLGDINKTEISSSIIFLLIVHLTTKNKYTGANMENIFIN